MAEKFDISAWTMAATPLVVAAGFIVRPYVSDFTDDTLVAGVVAESPDRWLGAALLMVAGALLLAFALPIAVRRVGGDERRVRTVRSAATVAAVLLALHVGMYSLGAAAVAKIGADVASYLQSSSALEVSILVLGLASLLVAWLGVARTAWSARLSRSIKWMVAIGATLGALGHWYPGSLGEYIASAGTAAGLWPLVPSRPRGSGSAALQTSKQ